MSWSTRFVFAFFAVLMTQFISIAGQARSPWQDTATADSFIQSFLGTISGSEAFTLDQLDDMSTIGDSLMTAMDTMTRNNKISQSKLQALDLGFASSMAEIAAVEQGGQSVDVKTNEIANALNSAFLQTTGTINTQFVDEIKNLSNIFAQASASEVAYATAGSGNAATNTGYSAGPVYLSWQGYKGVPQEQGPEEFRFQGPSTAAVVASSGFGGYRQGGQAAQSPGGYGPVSAKVSTAATDFGSYRQGGQDRGLSGSAAQSPGEYGPVSATVLTVAAGVGGYEQGGQGFVGPETLGQDRAASTRVAGNFVVSGQGKQDQGSVVLREYGSGSAAAVAATPNYLRGYGQDQGFGGYGSAGPGFQEPVNTAATVVAGGYSQGRQDQGLLGSGVQGPREYGPFSIAIALGGLGSYRQEVPIQEPPKSEFQGQGTAVIGELGLYDTGAQGGKGPGLTTSVSADTVGFSSYAPVIQGELQRPSEPGVQELRSASATSVTIGDNNAVRGNEGPYDLRIQGSGGTAATTTAAVAPSEIAGPGLQGGQVRSATGGTSAVAGREYGISAQRSTIPDAQGPSGLGPLESEGAAVTTNGLEGYGPIAKAPSGSGAQISDGYGPGNFAASAILGGYEVIAERPSVPGGVSPTAASADGIEYGGLQRPLGPGNQGTEEVPVATSRLEVYAPRAQVSSAPVRTTAIELQDYRPVAQAPSAPVGKTAIGMQDYGQVSQATAIGMQDYKLVSQAPSAPERATEIRLQYYGPVPQVPSAPVGKTAIGFQDYRSVPQAPSTSPQAPSAPERATAIGLQDYGPVPQTSSAPEGATPIRLQDYGPVPEAPSAPVGEIAIGVQDYGQVSQATAIGFQDYRSVSQAPSAPEGATEIRLQYYGPVPQVPSAPVGKIAIGFQDYRSVPQAPSAPVGETSIGFQDYRPVPQAPSAPEGATAIGMLDYGQVSQSKAIGLQDYGPVSQASSAPEGATSIVLQDYGPVPQAPSAPVGETAIGMQDYGQVSQATAIGMQDYGLVSQAPSAPEGATEIRLQYYGPVPQVPSAPEGETAIGIEDYGPVFQVISIGLQDYGPTPQSPSAPEGATTIASQDYVPVTQAPSVPERATAIGLQYYGQVPQALFAPEGATATGIQDYRPILQAPSAPEGATAIGLQDYGPVPQAPYAPAEATAIGFQYYGPVAQAPSAPAEATAIGFQYYGPVAQAPSAPAGETTIELKEIMDQSLKHIQRKYGPGEPPTVEVTLCELEGDGSAIQEPSGQGSQSLGGSSSGSAIIFSLVDGLGRYNQDAQGPQGPGEIVEASTTTGGYQGYGPVTQGPQRSSGPEGFYSYSVSLGAPGYRPRDKVPLGPSRAAFAAASRLSAPDSASRVSSAVSSLISSGPTNPVALSSVIDNAISQISAINPDFSDCEVLIQAVLEVFSALLNIYITSTWAR
ncbi:major ampullate spidroin 2B variant 1 [Trichonephila clavata]|uniref:Major ampullate spidroin 2B variant 1 n=1 Tax=Trichonephila clavata TaxID=2740835 RepID=A0A8X6LSM4_TRICU|nr:major ampullate spidroin 2B variant 1 [Trichonephila clavata]